jgi:hypothetical protein
MLNGLLLGIRDTIPLMQAYQIMSPIRPLKYVIVIPNGCTKLKAQIPPYTGDDNVVGEPTLTKEWMASLGTTGHEWQRRIHPNDARTLMLSVCYGGTCSYLQQIPSVPAPTREVPSYDLYGQLYSPRSRHQGHH